MLNEKMASRRELSPKERVKVIEYARKNPQVGSRGISGVFQCGRSQIQAILKKKETILSEYEANAPNSRKWHHQSAFEDVNKAMY